jgi:hypothetical protein
MQSIKENYKRTLILREEKKKNISYPLRIFYKTIKHSLRTLGLELNYMPKMSEEYFFSFLEKQYCHDFLIYCSIHADDLFFDLKHFTINDDKNEILKFVRNKIYGALMDSVENALLFDNVDLKYQKKYMIMEKKFKEKIRHTHYN